MKDLTLLYLLPWQPDPSISSSPVAKGKGKFSLSPAKKIHPVKPKLPSTGKYSTLFKKSFRKSQLPNANVWFFEFCWYRRTIFITRIYSSIKNSLSPVLPTIVPSCCPVVQTVVYQLLTVKIELCIVKYVRRVESVFHLFNSLLSLFKTGHCHSTWWIHHFNQN